VQAWIPVWLPFLLALGLEVQFFVSGYRARPTQLGQGDRGPQSRDLVDLGWDPELEDEEFTAYYGPYEDEPRRYGRHLAEAAVALAVVGGILFYAVRPHGWNAVSAANRAKAEAVFSQEATKIAGHPAGVVCDTSGEHVGVVQEADGAALVGGRVAYMLPSLCDELYQLRFKHRVRGSRTGRAIAVLAHEAWHLNGVANEGLANCFAFQSGVQVGVDLGLSESRARALMREQLATNASDSGSNTQYLVPPGCRDGGEYDLNPGSSAFP
jgi:hypothetical protein